MSFNPPSNKKPTSKPTKSSAGKATKTSANKVSKTSTGSKTTKPTKFKGSQNPTRVEKQW